MAKRVSTSKTLHKEADIEDQASDQANIVIADDDDEDFLLLDQEVQESKLALAISDKLDDEEKGNSSSSRGPIIKNDPELIEKTKSMI